MIRGGGVDAVYRAGVFAPEQVRLPVPWHWGDACAQSGSTLCGLAHGGEPPDAGSKKLSFVACTLQLADSLGASVLSQVVEQKWRRPLQRASSRRRGGVSACSAVAPAPRVYSRAVWAYSQPEQKY